VGRSGNTYDEELYLKRDELFFPAFPWHPTHQSLKSTLAIVLVNWVVAFFNHRPPWKWAARERIEREVEGVEGGCLGIKGWWQQGWVGHFGNAEGEGAKRYGLSLRREDNAGSRMV